MFKILNESVEIPINDRLIPADRRTRGGHNQAYKHIRANTTLRQNSFWHRTIPDWNSLPAAAIELKTCGSIQESAGRLDLSASSPPPFQPNTPQWRAAGVFTQSQSQRPRVRKSTMWSTWNAHKAMNGIMNDNRPC